MSAPHGMVDHIGSAVPATAAVDAVQVSDVSYRYTRNGPDVLSGIDLRVPTGTTVGLVGESGSGKSTLGRLIVNERQPTSGSILIEGQPWKGSGRRSGMRRAVQMIFQDPFGALNPYLSPLSAVAEAVGVTRHIRGREAKDAAAELLAKVGLDAKVIERTPASLSGGQRQRVVIARALACEPRILVADEATSALDVSVQAQILNLLMTLQQDLNLTMLFISHDMAVINHVTDQVAVLNGGRIVEFGDTERVMQAPEHPYTRKLLAAFDTEATERSA